jgi:hypothetical protein
MKKNVLLLVVAFILGLIAPLSINAQTCPGANRQLFNSKAQTANDAIGAVLKNFLTDGTNPAWLWESGATFVENPDGTARLRGVLRSYVSPTTHRLDVDVTFNARSFTPPMGSPVLMNTTPPTTEGWYYYEWAKGTMTGLNKLAGAKVNLKKRGKCLQIGIGGSDQVADIGRLSGTAWYSWSIVSQPTDPTLGIITFPDAPSIDQGDMLFQLSGTPTVCAPDPCQTQPLPSFIDAPTEPYVFTANGSGCAELRFERPRASGAVVTQESGPAPGSCQQPGTYTATFMATDICDHTTKATLTIIVKPDPCLIEPSPVFTKVPTEPFTFTADATGCAKLNFDRPVASNATVVQESGPEAGSCQKAGTYTAVYKATGGCNKTSTTTVTIIVKAYVDPCDSAPLPVFTKLPTAPFTFTADASGCAKIEFDRPVSSNSTVTQESGPEAGSCQKAGTYTAVYKATSGCNKTATTTVTIIVKPYVDPCETAPLPTFTKLPIEPYTFTTDASGCAKLLFDRPIASGAVVTQESGPEAGSCQKAGTYTLVYKAVGGCNKTSTATVTIVVKAYVDPCETMPIPTFTKLPTEPYNFTADATGCAKVTFDKPVATGATVTQESGPEVGSCQKTGTYTVVFKATNICNKTTTTTVTIIVKAFVDPCESAPLPTFTKLPTEPYTFTADASGCAKLNFERPLASGAVVTQESGPEAGSCQKAGTYTAVYKATSGCNKTSTTTITIIVKAFVDPCDSEPLPKFTNLPTAPYTFTAGASGCATVSFDRPIAPNAIVTQESGPAVGSCQKAGTYTVVFKAMGGCNKSSTTSITIVVNPYVNPCDSEPLPKFTNLPLGSYTFTVDASGCAKLDFNRPVASNAVVTQISGPEVGSCQKAGTYTIVFKAVGGCDKTTTATVTVVVNPDPCQNVALPTFLDAPTTPYTYSEDVTGCAKLTFTIPRATGGTVAQESGPVQGSCQKAGTYTAVYKATNNCNKTVTTTVTIVVKPYDPCQGEPFPTFIDAPTKPYTYTADASGCAKLTFERPRASGAMVTQDSGPEPGSCQKAGTYTAVFRATNWCNESVKTTLTIIVNPYVDPCQGEPFPAFIDAPTKPYTYTTDRVTGCAKLIFERPRASGAMVTQESGPEPGSCQKAGTYTAVFKATNWCDQFVKTTITIIVNADPCQGEPFPAFVDAPTKPYTYTTDRFTGCAKLTFERPRASGAMVTQESGPEPGSCQKAGTYTAVFKATNWCNESIKTTVTIIVNADPCQGEPFPAFVDCPTSAYTYTADATLCAKLTYDRPRASGAMVTLESGPEPGSCQKAGTYTAIYKATNWCNEFVKCTVTVIVKPYVDPCSISPTPTFTNCSTTALTFTASTTNCAIIKYTNPTASAGAKITVTGAASGSCLRAGSYNVIFTATDNCNKIARCTLKIVVNPYVELCDQVTNPGTIRGDDSFCPGGTISPVLAMSPATGGIGELEYLWMYSTYSSSFDAASWTILTTETNESLMNMPSLTRTAYFIRCVRRKGCNLFKESNVVTKSARAFAEITGPYEACVGSQVTFKATESSISSLYSWYFEGANISSVYTQTAQVKFTAAGSRRIRLEVASPGCLRTTSHYIEVKPCISSSGVISGLDAAVVNPTMVSVKWKTKGEIEPSKYVVEKSADAKEFIEIAEIQSKNNEDNVYSFDDHEPKMGRSYYRIKHIEADGNMVYTPVQQTLIYINGGDPVMAYPNPTTNKLYIEVLEGQKNEGVIEVYNAIGKLLKVQQYDQNQSRYEIDTQGFPAGSYIIRVRQNDGLIKSVKVSKL